MNFCVLESTPNASGVNCLWYWCQGSYKVVQLGARTIGAPLTYWWLEGLIATEAV
jgi:hypothetical protein